MTEFILNVKHYLKIFQNYLGRKMYYIFFLVFIAALAESIGIIMLIPLFEGIDSNPNDDPKNIISSFVRTIFIQLGIGENVETILFVICIVFIIKGFVMFLMLAYDAYLRSRLIILLRLNLYQLCENMNYEYFITRNTGYFVNILNTQIKKALDSFDSLSSFVTQTIFAFVYLTVKKDVFMIYYPAPSPYSLRPD